MSSFGLNANYAPGPVYPLNDDPIIKKLNDQRSCFSLPCKSELNQKLIQAVQNQEWNKSWANVKPLLIESFSSTDFSKLSLDIRKILRELAPDQSKEILNDIALKSIQENLPELVSRITELFTSDEMVKLGNENPKFEEARIAFMAKSADFHDELIFKDPNPTGLLKYYHIVANFLHGILDTILMAFSFFEIGQEPGSSWEASHMLQVYGQLFGIPLILMTFLSTILASPATAVLATAGILASVVVLLLVYVKYFKPMPENTRDTICLTAMVERGETEEIIGCEEDVQHMLNSVMAGQKVLMIGQSRVGKTKRFLALAQYLYKNRNNPNIPKWVRELRVMYLNAPDIVGMNMGGGEGGGGDKMSRLRTRTEKFWHKTLWCIDEGHVPVMPQYVAKSGTQFNILLDKQAHSMRHAIVATTDVGYSYIQRSDLRGRLKPMPVLQPDDIVIFRILQAKAARIAPEMEVSEEVLNAIITWSKKLLGDQMQPNISINILEEIVTAIKDVQNMTKTEKDLQKARITKNDIVNKGIYGGITRVNQALVDSLNKIEEEIKLLESARSKELVSLNELTKLKERKLFVNKTIIKLTQQIQKAKPEEKDKLLTQYYFNKSFLLKDLEEKIHKLHKKMNLPQLNENFIRVCIEKDIKLRETVPIANPPPSQLDPRFMDFDLGVQSRGVVAPLTLPSTQVSTSSSLNSDQTPPYNLGL